MKNKAPYLMLVLLATTVVTQAQTYIDIIKQSPKDATLETVSTRVNDFFANIPDEAEKNRQGYKLWKRWEWFASLHKDEDGKVASWTDYNTKAFNEIAAKPTLQAVNGSWTSAGPASISNNAGYLGRVECVGFHPTDPNTLYIGSGTGGVWKTTNLGVSWQAMSDYLPSLSISGIAVHPSNGNTLWVLTGDGDGGNQWGYYVKERGSGVFKSTDGGVTWQPTGLSFDRSTETVYGYKLIVNPGNANILLAATSDGIYRTSNGGTSWVKEIDGEFTDIEFRPNNSNHLAATAYGVDDLYISTDGGQNWRQKDVPGGTDMTRADLAVSGNSPNNVYMLMGPEGSGNFRGYYRFLWTDSSFTLLANTPNVFNGATDGAGAGGFAWWAIALGVSPTDVNNQLVGGVIGRRSTNGGSTIFGANDILHADQHGYWYSPLDGSVYATNDGGIMRSTNNGSTWTNITAGLRITQFYRISGTSDNVDMILGGTQDNGHYVRYSNTSQYKHSLTCCDGMDNAVDPNNPQIIYMCSQNGGLVRSTNGGDTWGAGIRPEASSWVAPIALHTSTPTTIFFAGNNGVWRNTNSGTGSWVNLGADGRGAIAQGISNTARFYAAGNNTTLRRSDNINDADPTWTTISGNTGWPTTGMGNSQITGITVNPSNSLEAWVCLSGYNAANKVLRTTNGGDSWANVTGDLPNVPVHAIKFAGSGSSVFEIYVGTDVGVFYRNNSTGDWIYFSNGLPRVIVTDIEINGTFIYAGTYGRGIWRSSLYSACPANLSFLFDLKGEWLYQASSTIVAPISIYGGVGTNVHMRAGSTVTLTPGFEALAGNIFKASVGPCNSTLPLGPLVPLDSKSSATGSEATLPAGSKKE